MRKDSDLLGEISVPDEAYYGAQTMRAINLHNTSNEVITKFPSFIYCMGAIKKACAIVHRDLGLLSDEITAAIIKASEEMMAGKFVDHLKLDMLAGNDLSPVHMNFNEVLACRANELITGQKGFDTVQPNSHVNMGLSTCDSGYAAAKFAIYLEMGKVLDAIKSLSNAYNGLAEKYKNSVKISHTCFQDASPITFGQFYGAAHHFLERQIKLTSPLREELLNHTIGYTVIGTGQGALGGFRERINPVLSEILGIKTRHAADPIDDLQYTDIFIRVSAQLKATMTGISKMARDIRIMCSGPRAGFNEISIAPVQNGSSFFPGKVNPSLAELINVACYEVCAYDSGITMAVEAGELDVTPWYQVFTVNLLNSCTLMSNTIPAFAEKCVTTIQPNEELNNYKVERSLGMATAVSAMFGYKTATQITNYALAHDMPIKKAAVALGFINAEQAERIFDPLLLTDADKCAKLLYELADRKNRF